MDKYWPLSHLSLPVFLLSHRNGGFSRIIDLWFWIKWFLFFRTIWIYCVWLWNWSKCQRFWKNVRSFNMLIYIENPRSFLHGTIDQLSLYIRMEQFGFVMKIVFLTSITHCRKTSLLSLDMFFSFHGLFSLLGVHFNIDGNYWNVFNMCPGNILTGRFSKELSDPFTFMNIQLLW